MKTFLWQMLNSTALRAPDDETGSGDGGALDGSNDAGNGGNAGNQGGAQKEEPKHSRFAGKGLAGAIKPEDNEEEDGDKPKAPPAPGQRPDNVPEKFWDAKAGAVRTDALTRAYLDLETKMRNGGKIDPDDVVPEEATVEAYFGEGVELDPEVDRLGLEPDDPGLKVAADVFKKYGIGKKTATMIVKDMFKGMNEHAPTPIDPEQELKALGPNGKAAVEGTFVWLEKLDREGKLSDDEADLAVELMGTARGVKLLNKLRGMTGDLPIPVGHHVPSAGGMSPDEWHIAYQEAVAAKNYKKQEELDRISAGVFGTGSASGSPLRGLPGR